MIVSAWWQADRQWITALCDTGAARTIGCITPGNPASADDVELGAFLRAGGLVADRAPAPTKVSQLDAQMLSIETSHPFTHRSLRDATLILPQLCDLLNDRLLAIETQMNADFQSIAALLPTLGKRSFTLPRVLDANGIPLVPARTLPDLKPAFCIQRGSALEAQISALRSLRNAP